MTDALARFIEAGGVWAVALLMFVETLFPPIPSEVIMPLAGVHAAAGGSPLAAVIAAGTLGAMLGNAAWFWLAWQLGPARLDRFIARHGRWLTLTLADLARVRSAFHRFGGGIVGFGRMVPTIRSLISVPAGLARMRPLPFLVWSTLGTACWTAGLALAGWWLGSRHQAVGLWLESLSGVVVAALLLVYVVRVLSWPRRAA